MSNPMELRVERSTDPNSPYLLRIYDVGQSPARKIAYSETYRQRSGAINAAQAIQALRWNFETFQGADAKWYWRLRSTNGERLVRSSLHYDTQADANWRSTWLKTNAPTALVTG